MTNEELIKRYKDGDIFALNELTEQNMGLIRFIASKYSTDCNFIDQDDLIQTGWTGFYQAVQRYDPDHPKAAKLSTYAIYWIRQAISRYLRQKVPKVETSLHVPLTDDGDVLLIDTIEDVDDDSFREMWRRLENWELHKELDDLMQKYLSLRHREILQMRYGWNNLKPMTLDEIGELYGITSQAVRQQHNKALRRLRQTQWTRLRAADMRRESVTKLRYHDPLDVLIAKYEKYLDDSLKDFILRRNNTKLN